MSEPLTRRAVVLGKIQTAEGTPATPVKQLNGLLVSDMSFSVNGEQIERQDLRDSLSPLPHRMGRKLFEARFSFELRSGPGAGVRPEWSPLMRAAGMEETVSAVLTSLIDSVPTYKWTVSSSGTSEYYVDLNGGGDPSLAEPTGVYENGEDMHEGTLGSLAAGEWAYGDNDSLGFSTVYVRLTDSTDPDSKADDYVQHVAGTSVTYDFRDSSFEFGTFYLYPDGHLISCTDAIVDITDITWNAGGIATAQARLQSQYADPTDVVLPTGVLYQSHLPPTAQSMAFTLDAFSTGLVPTFSINYGTQIAELRDVNSAYGLKGLRNAGRNPTGRVTIMQELVATFPFIKKYADATEMTWSAAMTDESGRRMTFSSPSVQFSSAESADINGIRAYNLGLKFNAPSTTKEFKIFLDETT